MKNSSVLKLTNPIVNFRYLGANDESPVNEKPSLESLSETTERPRALDGSTYKLKSPIYEAALYITINNITLNANTPHQVTRPFEIFINSKAMESFQWIVSLTRMISAVFRKGGDVTFIIEELKSVNDPRGGYWNKGKYITSIVAEIAETIEYHFIQLGLLTALEDLDVPDIVVKKSKSSKIMRICPSCQAPTLSKESSCDVCLSCGWSRCG